MRTTKIDETKKWFHEQGHWHGVSSCGTTHCRAGGAVVEAKAEDLEKLIGSAMAGAMIYMVSTGKVPDFYNTNNEEVFADMKSCAELE